MSSDRYDMTDQEWELLQPLLPTGRPGPVRKDDRKVMNGIFHILRTGAPWRDLPPQYGPYTTCVNRYNRWSRDGTWARIMKDLHALSKGRVDRDDDDSDGGSSSLEVRMIDSSTVRVHKHGSNARRDGEARAIGRSRGGLTTKIHVAVDGTGYPASMHLTPGQVADCTRATTLLAGMTEGVTVIADRAYDTNDLLAQVEEVKGVAVIPSKSNRKVQRCLDRELYGTRNIVERFFGRIKEYRRVATRYEKRARNYLSTVLLTVTRYLLREMAREVN